MEILFIVKYYEFESILEHRKNFNINELEHHKNIFLIMFQHSCSHGKHITNLQCKNKNRSNKWLQKRENWFTALHASNFIFSLLF